MWSEAEKVWAGLGLRPISSLTHLRPWCGACGSDACTPPALAAMAEGARGRRLHGVTVVAAAATPPGTAPTEPRGEAARARRGDLSTPLVESSSSMRAVRGSLDPVTRAGLRAGTAGVPLNGES